MINVQLGVDSTVLIYLLNDPWTLISIIGIIIFKSIIPTLLKIFHETWTENFIRAKKEQIDVPAKKSRSAKNVRSQ